MDAQRSRPTALGYLSSSGAARLDDASLRGQTAALKRFCARRRWELVALVHDVEPAKRRSSARPALSYAIDRLTREDISCLLVTDLGRLCRSIAELNGVLHELERVNARLVCLQPEIDTGTESGRTAARILFAVSSWERLRAAERSRNGLAAARARGAIQPTIDPGLKRHIERMRRAGMTLQAIADDLNATSVPTVRGGAKWRVSSVQAAVGYKRPAKV